MDQNPYKASTQITHHPHANHVGLNRSILSQIRVVSILLIVHGLLLILMGIVYGGLALFMPALLTAQNPQQFQRPGAANPEQMKTIFLITYGLMGATGFFPGVLQVIAGISNLGLKGRVLGFIALFSGFLSIGTCYCIPTSLGLGIYGLIIYFHESAAKAFSLGAEGKSLADVERMAS